MFIPFKKREKLLLDDILTHPNGTIESNRFGGLDYYAPDGRGARYYNDGSFRGFLEPYGNNIKNS